jgi:hypothetical protein
MNKVKKQEEKIKKRSEAKRGNAKSTRQSSTSKTQVIVALSALASITSEAPSIVLG